jgi:hypothetical protein
LYCVASLLLAFRAEILSTEAQITWYFEEVNSPLGKGGLGGISKFNILENLCFNT